MGLNHSYNAIVLFSEPVLGRVEQLLTGTEAGRVAALASSWPAEVFQAGASKASTIGLAVGDFVEVIGRRGITLLVKPVESAVESAVETAKSARSKASVRTAG